MWSSPHSKTRPTSLGPGSLPQVYLYVPLEFIPLYMTQEPWDNVFNGPPALDTYLYPSRSALDMAARMSFLWHKKEIYSFSVWTCSKLLCLTDWVQTLSSLAFKTLVYLPRPAFSSSPFPISSPSCTGLLSVVTMCSCTSCSLYSMSCCFPVLEWIVQPYKS